MLSQHLTLHFTKEMAVHWKEQLCHPWKLSMTEVPGAGSPVFMDWEQHRLKQDVSLDFET